jgi:hypothetical protein
MQIMMGMRDELFSGMECVRKFKVRIEVFWFLESGQWAIRNCARCLAARRPP